MASSPPAAEEVPMAPGFRFHPTDEELVSYYLRRRVLGRRLRIDAIAEVDLYRLEPWDLPPLSRIRSRDAQWYFFARLDRKVAGAGAGGRGGPGNRTNRATPRGYWKTTGKDREVSHRGRAVGMKKTLVFHAGRAPKGDRTNWVMHEYRLLDNDGPQDMHVVCRIFQKVGSGPQNGAQYGAPYMEEEWEDEDDAIENAPTSGTSTEMLAITDTASAESNVEDENVFSEINELVQIQGVLIPPEIVTPLQAMAPLQAQGLNETGMSSYADGNVSPDELLQEPVSDVSVDNTGEPEEQSPIDDHFSLADLSGCPNQDDGYVHQAGPTMWSDPSNGYQAYYPIRTYGNRNHANRALSDEEFIGTENDTNAYSGQQQACPSDDQNLYSGQQQDCPSDDQNLYSRQQQDCPSDDQNLYGLSFPQQVGDDEPFYEASSDHKWVDGNDDCLNVNDLFDDDIMAFLNASEDNFSLDLMGPVDGSNSQLPAASNFDQKDEAKAQYGASSSGSRENLYPDIVVPDVPMDDNVGKRFGKFTNMLGSYPAPPAMASEFPPTTGKSIAALSGPSQIRVTAGIVQLGDHGFTGNSDNWPLQKNGVFNLLLSFTVESNVSTKSISFDDEPATTRLSTVPTVLRGGLYLFFVSAMILMLSFKVGSCIYSRKTDASPLPQRDIGGFSVLHNPPSHGTFIPGIKTWSQIQLMLAKAVRALYLDNPPPQDSPAVPSFLVMYTVDCR